MRIEQPEGKHGSLKWIQRLVEKQPHRVVEQLRANGALPVGNNLTWLSPLRDDHWAEYRDGLFLDRIGHPQLRAALKLFWPSRGPQWDALAKDDDSGRVFLFEAKAHGTEMFSSCQAGARSLEIIDRSSADAKQHFRPNPRSDWLNGYYQYANRLAHLNFLHRNGVDARMVFIYFTGDHDIKGPRSESEWVPLIEAAYSHLGLSEKPSGVTTIFQPVDCL